MTVDLQHLSCSHAEKFLTCWYIFGVHFFVQGKHRNLAQDKKTTAGSSDGRGGSTNDHNKTVRPKVCKLLHIYPNSLHGFVCLPQPLIIKPPVLRFICPIDTWASLMALQKMLTHFCCGAACDSSKKISPTIRHRQLALMPPCHPRCHPRTTLWSVHP